MARYILGRLSSSLIVLLLVTTVTFALIQIAPGGLATLMDPNLEPEDRERLAAQMGLDQPVHVQYWRWITNVSRGDLGRSLTYGRPVTDMVLERVPATLLLAGAALVITVLVGVPLGIYSAVRQYSLADQLLSFASFVGLATPNFWLGILLIIFFSVKLGWLPAAGMVTAGQSTSAVDLLRHLILPASVLATSTVAQIMRYTRSSWLEVIQMDYVTVARAKGLAERAVQLRHVMKNAMIPVVTVVGLFLPRLVGGAAVVEALFSWPGMGRLAVDAASRRDMPLVLGVTIIVSLAVIVSNLIIDLLYPVLDPRIRH